jgi:hypothetical protein
LFSMPPPLRIPPLQLTFRRSVPSKLTIPPFRDRTDNSHGVESYLYDGPADPNVCAQPWVLRQSNRSTRRCLIQLGYKRLLCLLRRTIGAYGSRKPMCVPRRRSSRCPAARAPDRRNSGAGIPCRCGGATKIGERCAAHRRVQARRDRRRPGRGGGHRRGPPAGLAPVRAFPLGALRIVHRDKNDTRGGKIGQRAI